MLLSVLPGILPVDAKAANAGARARTAHRKLQILDGFKILWTTPKINNLDWSCIEDAKVWAAGSVYVGVRLDVSMPSVFIASATSCLTPLSNGPKRWISRAEMAKGNVACSDRAL